MASKKKPVARGLSTVILVLCGVILACAVGEGMVRLATANQKNNLIEMWRYAGLLNRRSADPAVGHELIPNRSARLEGVEVSINSLGMRGPEPDLVSPGKQHILIIGDSIAMGWGVPEHETLRGQLAARLGPQAVVMTSGVCDMNMSQMVAHGLRYSAKVRPQTVILLATLHAPAIQGREHGGWLIRHSELWALVESFVKVIGDNAFGNRNMAESARAMWSGGPGRAAMNAALNRLKQDQEKYGYRVIVMMVPEPHSFHPYRFGFMAKIMSAEAKKRGWAFIDPEPEMRDAPARSYWVAADDVHPNAKALRIFSRLLLPYLIPVHG